MSSRTVKPRDRARHTGRREYATSYAGIDRRVMLSDSFAAIGPNGLRVLLWLAFQYKGSNNGYLSATRQQAKEWGIGGADTLARAIAELREHRLIVLTRQGRFTNPGGSPNLYALTWEPIHDKAGNALDMPPTRTPVRTDWRRAVENASPCPVLESVAPVSGQGRA